MTDVDPDCPDAHRLELLRRVFEPSSLDDVAEAVAVASEHARRLYVERVDGGYRWSFTHPGGGHPLLRIAARFLRVNYTYLRVGFRTVTDGVYVLCADPEQSTIAAAWAVVEFDGPTSSEGAGERIELALSSVK
jgi:hypothetical protein